MEFQTIELSQQDGITRIALNRPEVMNALNNVMRAEITAAMTDLAPGTRCVVLTGTGRAFCSGQDLTDARAGLDVERVLREEYEPMLAAIREAPVP
ncbi:MAG TPA: enoyl-CoA hydratase-related protein, partial [Paracoccus sp. (in: a-proteobacteria)]|nr:enoyl-CoA hydratase-related protein [Paracoccus sp. (in: a-proteobacteria)]